VPPAWPACPRWMQSGQTELYAHSRIGARFQVGQREPSQDSQDRSGRLRINRAWWGLRPGRHESCPPFRVTPGLSTLGGQPYGMGFTEPGDPILSLALHPWWAALWHGMAAEEVPEKICGVKPSFASLPGGPLMLHPFDLTPMHLCPIHAVVEGPAGGSPLVVEDRGLL